MMRGAVVLRPEPGNAATVARLRDAGIDTLALPLFAVRPVAWSLPDPAGFDAVLFTSANAARHGGAGLAALTYLPAIAVGGATATAARAAGFDVVATGAGDAAAVLADSRFRRPLHLAGREHRAAVADRVTVYASHAVPLAAADLTATADRVALLHSARAASTFAALIEPDARARVAVAALSPAVCDAAGEGWAWRVAASTPSDAALTALVAERLTGRDPPRISTI